MYETIMHVVVQINVANKLLIEPTTEARQERSLQYKLAYTDIVYPN